MAINLASLKKNTPKAPRIIVHGAAGVGKTSLACAAPNPVVIRTEDGLGVISVDSFPLAESYQDVIDAIGALYTEDHQFQTLVIDSLDWMEPLIWQKVCADNKCASIEALGYGKGYVEALYHWRTFFDGITALRDHKDMIIIMTAHSEIKRVEDPTMPSYDRHDLKLHKRAAALADEFSDVILFATQQTKMVTEDQGFGNKRSRAVTTGERLMHTSGQPAFLAKSRFPIPTPLPLEWEALAEALGMTTKAAA
jgi:hypothetical protein